MKLVLVCLAAVSITFSMIAAYVSNELEAQHVRLKFERGSTIACIICTVDVYLDGAKIGSVGNGEEKEFLLPPDATSAYRVGARLIPKLGPDHDILEKSVTAPVGSIIYARYEIIGWVLQARPEVKLDLAVQRSPISRSALIPSSVANAASGAVSQFTPHQANLPWDAIGAIAGILGTIVAIIALFKRG